MFHLHPSVTGPPAEGPSVAIHIQSEGCDDPGKTKDTCGIAYIFVNGVDRSPHLRGYNVVILDAATGKLLTVQTERGRTSARRAFTPSFSDRPS